MMSVVPRCLRWSRVSVVPVASIVPTMSVVPYMVSVVPTLSMVPMVWLNVKKKLAKLKKKSELLKNFKSMFSIVSTC